MKNIKLIILLSATLLLCSCFKNYNGNVVCMPNDEDRYYTIVYKVYYTQNTIVTKIAHSNVGFSWGVSSLRGGFNYLYEGSLISNGGINKLEATNAPIQVVKYYYEVNGKTFNATNLDN